MRRQRCASIWGCGQRPIAMWWRARRGRLIDGRYGRLKAGHDGGEGPAMTGVRVWGTAFHRTERQSITHDIVERSQIQGLPVGTALGWGGSGFAIGACRARTARFSAATSADSDLD